MKSVLFLRFMSPCGVPGTNASSLTSLSLHTFRLVTSPSPSLSFSFSFPFSFLLFHTLTLIIYTFTKFSSKFLIQQS
jgi:hypothetical protein